MKAPLSWLKSYVDINISPEELASKMTLSGSKVEGIIFQGEEIKNVVLGKIIEIEKHPDADKLQVTKVDVGNEVIQVVTGANNIKLGDFIPVALVGALLPSGKKITKGKLRGIESNGMMCSISELNLTKEDYPEAPENGIFILEHGLPLGKDIKEVLGINETILEFEITSNRPDCFSMIGLAREAAVTIGSSLNKPEIMLQEKGNDVENYASVEIKDADLCPRYVGRIVTNVKIGQSPKWMRNRLKNAGIRPINNIVDITNYVCLELGQPMHAFDLEALEGKKIVVRRARDGEEITTLDGKERKLDSSMLVIADSTKPVAVAGVMGGQNSEVTENTSTILFEAATFAGHSVRRTAQKMGLRTEASARFEKGLDVENVVIAIDRAAQLVEELGIGIVSRGVIDVYPKKMEKIVIKFEPEKINMLLGTDIEADEMIRILKSLEFNVDRVSMTLTVPTFRSDIAVMADIAEEIARFYDYNNIKPAFLSGKSFTLGKRSYAQKIEDMIKQIMVSSGLYETYTYSFTSPKVFDKLNLPGNSELRNVVKIKNPLGEDYSIMRTTTIPEMLTVLSLNFNRRVENAGFFEISNIYLPKNNGKEELPDEKAMLTMGMYGGEVDFYTLKGVVEILLEDLGIFDFNFEPVSLSSSLPSAPNVFSPAQEESNQIRVEELATCFHPGRTAVLVINGKKAGIFGEIHPAVSENFECGERNYIAVIEVEMLIKNAKLVSQYKPLPKFPAVSRDIAMLVRDDVLAADMDKLIKMRAGKILEAAKLFDVYKGKQIPEGMKSVAYSITFRASDRTLTDEEVNKAMAKILDGLEKNLGAEIRK